MRYKWKLSLVLIGLMCTVITVPGYVCGETAGSVDIRVSSGDDDAEENDSGGMSLGSSDLELVNDGWRGNQKIGLRFRNVTVPRGSTITNAYIEFTVDEATSELTTLAIVGEAAGNPSSFSGSSNDISDRPPTDAHVTWANVPEWNTVGDRHQTPDLTAIIQEIVDGGDWYGGNAMVFLMAGTGRRVAESYNGDSDKAALLHVEYTSNAVEVRVSEGDDDAEEASDGTMNLYSSDLEMIREATDQKVAIRFQNVTVPPGAVIVDAYIEFVADETSSQDTSLDIRAQADNDPYAFSSSAGDISARTTTDQHVEWNTVPAWDTVGEKYRTPDLKSVVQEVVGRTGWSSGNSMVFFVTGSGKRIAESYNGESGKAPFLHISYGEDEVPFIAPAPTTLGASCYLGSNPTDTSLAISNTGSGVMDYTIVDNADWLTVSDPSTGTLAAGGSVSYTVSYDAFSLAEGIHEATITIEDPNAPNSPFEIGVSLTVLALPQGSACGHVPVYTENLVSPAIMVFLDVSSSMNRLMNISSGQANPQTPDLKTIVQEIVSRPTWAQGNAMSFIITGSGRRTAESYNGETGSAPLLRVTYNDGTEHQLEYRVAHSSDDAEEKSDGSMSLTSTDLELVRDGSDQTVGMRFQNVAIPKEAPITSAYIEFVIDESDSESTSVTIWGEASDNSPPFDSDTNDITDRALTTASVAWNDIPEWGGVTQQARVEIGKSVISDLVKDRSISWGYGTWAFTGYDADDDYTKVHVGCKTHDDAHQALLQDAVNATHTTSGTPFGPSLIAAKKYFLGEKKDDDGDGDFYVPVACQPMFLIDVTDGLGYPPHTTVDLVEEYTDDLCGEEVTPIAVGFGIDNATQIQKMAEVANERGEEFDTDSLYALHEETGGIGQPFLANNKEELIQALTTITEKIKSAVFNGSAPAPTTSVDLGDAVIVAKFDATDWSGDLEAVSESSPGQWDSVLWRASEKIPATRKVFTIDTDESTVIAYTDSTLANDNYLCKDIGDIINSTPIVIGRPPFYYSFDDYRSFQATTRDPVVYVGANDGSLHAFALADGEEQWAFVPYNLKSKLDKAQTDPVFDMCGNDYCHQYFVDASPQVGDIYDGTDWKTILVCGEREGGEAYFALAVTSGKPFDDGSDPSAYLWEFTDSELGQTWADVSIDRVAFGSDGTWAVFFGSGYASTGQESKEAYLYGIAATDKAALWNDGTTDINRVKISSTELTDDALASPLVADLEGNDIADRIYVGNLYGTMYRASNIGRGQEPSVTKLFDFDPPCATPHLNPIRAKASYAFGTGSGNIWVYYGTGRYETQADKTNMNQQYFLGLKDSATPVSTYALDDLASLNAIYVTDTVTGKQIRTIDGSNPSPYQSWAISLDNTSYGLMGSERVTQQPLVVGGVVFFSTFIPDQDVCAGNGTTWVFAVDYQTGLAPDAPVFDLNGDGVINTNDKAVDDNGNVHNVAAISVGEGQGSNPVLFKDTLFVTTTGGGIDALTVNLPNARVRIGSWRQN